MKHSFGTWVERRFTRLLLVVVVGTFALRTAPLVSRVITPDAIRFQEVDAYYHARLAELLVRHYPHRPSFDPYRLHPNGQGIDVHPLQDHIVAPVAIIAGIGDPSVRTIHLTAAWIPPILGTLSALLIGLLGKRVGGGVVGLSSAFVCGVIPGGTLSQSVLGYADHHALEAMLVALVLWSTTEAIAATSKPRSLVQWAVSGCGVALYALTWVGGPGLVAVFLASVAVWTMVDGRVAEGGGNALSGTLLAAAVAAMVLLISRWWVPPVIITAGMLLLVPLIPLSMRVFRSSSSLPFRTMRWIWLGAMISVTGGILLVMPSSILGSLATDLARFWPSNEAKTVRELRALYETGEGPWIQVWEFYVAAPIAALMGLILAQRKVQNESAVALIVVMVAGIMLIPAAFLQLRFAATASLPMSVLAALPLATAFHAFAPMERWLRNRRIRIAAIAIWLILLPGVSLPKAWAIATLDRGPDKDWMEAMDWLRTKTPEPFTDPNVFVGDGTSKERSSYGVHCWWDAGYYVEVMGKRVPTSNPTQAGATSVSRSFLESRPEEIVGYFDGRRIRYVIVDATLPLIPVGQQKVYGKFPALESWAGIREDSLRATWYSVGPGGTPVPMFVYFPAYFRTLVVRLSLHGNERVRPSLTSVWLMKTERTRTSVGESVTVITAAEQFPSYEQAEGVQRTRSGEAWHIVSRSPIETCVPLEPIEGLREVFRSQHTAFRIPGTEWEVPHVRVFERKGRTEE